MSAAPTNPKRYAVWKPRGGGHLAGEDLVGYLRFDGRRGAPVWEGITGALKPRERDSVIESFSEGIVATRPGKTGGLSVLRQIYLEPGTPEHFHAKVQNLPNGLFIAPEPKK